MAKGKVPAKSKASNKRKSAAPRKREAKKPVRIVAIGASAGGLEPYEDFFDALPPNSGLAFVIIQHLSPDFRSMMDELLARHTSLPIHRMEDGMELEANAIYLNAPRSVMVVEGNKLSLLEPEKMESISLPINTFFESLAAERGADSVGVVLSGTGSDGTEGCAAIKRAGGVVFVQDPQTAKFDGMPNSVIAGGWSDIVTPSREIPQYILDHLSGEPLVQSSKLLAEYETPLEAILGLLRDRVGTDFSMYKTLTIERRVRRRSEMRGESDLTKYLEIVENEPEEVSTLYNDLLIEVTSFFRDRDAFAVMDELVIPDIAALMSEERQIRVWVAGCASGEEAYSIAILFSDYAREHGLTLNLKILATDIHSRSLDAASSGIYTEQALKSLSADRIARYFVKEGSYYQISQALRKHVVFSPHSLLGDPPFTRMDLISCRNVLIYFNDEAQHKALSLFHFSLSKNGYLFLGPSETVGQLSDEFKTVHQRWRIFQKTRDVRLLESARVMNSKGQTSRDMGIAAISPQLTGPTPSFQPSARRAFNEALQSLLSQYAPTGFLISPIGDLIHIFGDAGDFISVGSGGFSNRIVDLIQDQLKLPVSAALERSKGTAKGGFRRRVRFVEPNGSAYHVTITLNPLPDATGQVDYLLLVLEKSADTQTVEATENLAETLQVSDAVEVLQSRILDLEGDLESTEESLQTTIEELETSNEELQATNEELMASNEELQSTNEELHSVNEELYTVSHEHQRKIEELTELTDDMDHLLKSTDIGTIFLDEDLKIRRFTPAANKAFNLISQDVGRPISHITYRFEAAGLGNAIQGARDTGVASDHEVDVDGHAYLVRILPFAPVPKEILGVVIIIIDIQALKSAQAETKAQSDFYAGVLADLSEFIVRWNADDGIITYANQAFEAIEQMPMERILGRSIYEVVPESQQKDFFSAIESLQVGGSTQLKVRHQAPDGRDQWRDVTVRAIGGEDGKVAVFQKTGRDATKSTNYLTALKALIDTPDGADYSYDDWLGKYLDIGKTYFGVEHASLSRMEEGVALITAYSGDKTELYPDGVREDFKNSLCAEVAKSGDIIVEHDLLNGDFNKSTNATKLGVKSYIAAPVEIDGDLYGVVEFFSHNQTRQEPFSGQDIGFLRLMAQWMRYKFERISQLTAIRRSEQELQHIFDHVPARIWYKNDKNIILRLNKTAAESMGQSVEEIVGTDTHDIFPDQTEEYHQDDLDVLASGEPKIGTVEPYSPSKGQHGWVRTDKVPYIDTSSGERNLLVVSQDITELKEAEIQLLGLNEELDRQKQHYFNLYRNTPVMMQSITEDGKIVEVSNQWIEKLGYERDDVIGRKAMDFMTDAAKKFNESVVLPDLWKKGYCASIPHQFVTKSGEVIDVELSGVIDRTDATSPRGLGVLIDVTDRNAALSEIEKKNIELEQANDGLLKFAYVASHDLQEPLRKIRQFSEMLAADHEDGLDSEGKYYLGVVTSSAARMSRLIRDLLNYSKTSNQGVQKTEEDLSAVAQGVVADLDISIKDSNAKITIGKLPTVSCDRTMTGQLFANLIGNSIKYRKPDVDPKIKISSKKLKTGLQIIFQDNGIGFRQAHAKKIFDPFSRLHGAKEFDGSGIGLAVCRAVCERHGWTIEAEGVNGEGAIFTITIPNI